MGWGLGIGGHGHGSWVDIGEDRLTRQPPALKRRSPCKQRQHKQSCTRLLFPEENWMGLPPSNLLRGFEKRIV